MLPPAPSRMTLDAAEARLRDALAIVSAPLAATPLTDDVKLLSRDALLAFHEAGQTDAVEARLLPLAVRVMQAHLSLHGWPLPPAESLDVTRSKLRAWAGKNEGQDRLSGKSSTGVRFLRSRFLSFWMAGATGGAVGAAQLPRKLRAVLAYRMGINRKRETFDLSTKTMRRGFLVGRYTVSTFKPAVAAALYKRWMPEGRPVTVWDPSGGFGARMLGFSAVAPQGSTYIANEPASRTRADLVALGLDLPIEVVVRSAGSEVEGPGCEVDLVLTSPPYYDKERYFDEPGQCWRDFSTEPDWEAGYLRPTMQRAFDALRPGGRLVLNVDRAREEAVRILAVQIGFLREHEQRLALGADHFQRARGQKTDNSEPIMVFRKPDGAAVHVEPASAPEPSSPPASAPLSLPFPPLPAASGRRQDDPALARVCAELRAEGRLELVDAARLLDCTVDVARRVIRDVGLPQKPRKAAQRRLSPALRTQVRALFAEGATRDEVNERLDLDLTPQAAYYYKGTST